MPVQVAQVRVPIDPHLDVASFTLGSLGFGSHTIDVPPNRSTYTVQPYFGDLGLYVRIVAGIDITREPMEVGPTTHYMMGGVRVDAETQMSTVPGLFAAGECAAGLHGANRLGGNSLSDLLVFGKRAGEFAAHWASDHAAGKNRPVLGQSRARRKCGGLGLCQALRLVNEGARPR